MDIFNAAKDKAESLKQEIQDIKTNVSGRLDILNKQYAYLMNQTEALSIADQADAGEKIVFADADKYGDFDSFGISIHPKLIKTPRNLFNFQ